MLIESNLLVGLALTLVSNFTASVHIPYESVQCRASPTARLRIGSLYSPVDVFLMYSNGTSFWIRDGAVESFESPRSYFHLQDPTRISTFTGRGLLSSNQVLDLATKTIRGLAHGNSPIEGVRPKIECGFPEPNGDEVPFYRITWPTHKHPIFDTIAQIEVDARDGTIVFLQVLDPSFFDYTFARTMSNCVKSVSNDRIKERYAGLRPGTNDVVTVMRNWARFCEQLGFRSYVGKTISDIDWDRTTLYTDLSGFDHRIISQIRFADGTCFESSGNRVRSHFESDSCFTGAWDDRPRAEWEKFKGMVTLDWHPVAKRLERTLAERFGIPENQFDRLHARTFQRVAPVGTEGLVRCVVRWLSQEEEGSISPGLEARGSLAAEFDLHNGELKWIEINDFQLLDLLRE
jgi:hypothetical protein